MNKQLVEGEALINKASRPQGMGALALGFSEGMKAVNLRMQQVKEAKKAINSTVAGYIDQLGSVDISSLTDSQQQAVTNFLVKKRNEYASYASEIAKIEDPASNRYLELRDKINGIQNSFQNLSTQIDSYKEDKVQYLKDFDGGRISDGNPLNTLGEAANIYTDKAQLGVSDGGALVFWNEGKGTYDAYAQAQKPFLKDYASADAILQLNESLYSAGSSLQGARKNMIRQKLNNIISKGGRQTLLSLATDDFVMEGGLGIMDDTLFQPENEDALKATVLDTYMDLLSKTADQGARDKRPASSRGSGGFSGALKDEINIANESVLPTALQFSTLSQNVKPEIREQKTQALLDVINNIDPTKQSNYVSRGTFYNMWLEGMDEDDTTETRNKFIKKYGRGQIFQYNKSNPSESRAVPINTDDPEQLYSFYIKNAGLSQKATNYYLGNYNNYIKQLNKNQSSSSNQGGAYDNL